MSARKVFEDAVVVLKALSAAAASARSEVQHLSRVLEGEPAVTEGKSKTSAHDYSKPYGWPESAHPKPVSANPKPVIIVRESAHDYDLGWPGPESAHPKPVWAKPEPSQKVFQETYLTH